MAKIVRDSDIAADIGNAVTRALQALGIESEKIDVFVDTLEIRVLVKLPEA